jgi:4-diphosphocytidyl-2-C-methyl-D-erythritol kinase
MRAIYDVPAPAKLNLFLHITGRRADGYHLLESAFMLIDWADTLHFEIRRDGQISREDLTAALPADDLVLRAARALQHATGCTHGAHIAIDKQVPAQAGMGGGSSDAASTLLALARLWQVRLPPADWMALGLTLGADVPFFLGGHNAWVQGVGEVLTPITVPAARFVVLKPADGLETRAIFSHSELKRNTEHAILSEFVANAFGYGHNDLQAVAQHICPGVGAALGWLHQHELSGKMTGSGSAVFAHTLQDVDLSGLPAHTLGRHCNNLPVHPLVGWGAG